MCVIDEYGQCAIEIYYVIVVVMDRNSDPCTGSGVLAEAVGGL